MTVELAIYYIILAYWIITFCVFIHFHSEGKSMVENLPSPIDKLIIFSIPFSILFLVFRIMEISIIASIIAAIVISIVGLYILSLETSEQKAERLQREGILQFYKKDGILVLKSRNPELESILKIKKRINFDVKYKPEEYVYTSATVGGITTGGIHKQGDYHYLTNYQSSGKYMLTLLDSEIIKIVVSKRISTKNSTISKYIKNNEILLVDFNAVNVPDLAATRAVSGDLNSINFMNKRINDAYPTREKCEEIKNWICGYN